MSNNVLKDVPEWASCFIYVERSSFQSKRAPQVDGENVSDICPSTNCPGDNDVQSYELKVCDLGTNNGVMINLSHPVEDSASIILPSEKVIELVKYLKGTLCLQAPSKEPSIFRADRATHSANKRIQA